MAQPSQADVISNWNHLFENCQASSKEFYTSLETAIQARQVPDAQVSHVDYKEGGALSARREYLRVKRGRNVFDICAAPFGTSFFVSWWLSESRSPYGLLYLIAIVVGFFLLGGICFNIFATVVGYDVAIVLAIVGFPFALVIGLPLFIWLLGTIIRSQEGLDDFVLDIPLIGPLYNRLFHPITYYKIDTAIMFQAIISSAVFEVIDGMTQNKGIRALTEDERKPMMKEFYQRKGAPVR